MNIGQISSVDQDVSDIPTGLRVFVPIDAQDQDKNLEIKSKRLFFVYLKLGTTKTDTNLRSIDIGSQGKLPLGSIASLDLVHLGGPWQNQCL